MFIVPRIAGIGMIPELCQQEQKIYKRAGKAGSLFFLSPGKSRPFRQMAPINQEAALERLSAYI